MNGRELRALLDPVLEAMLEHTDELRRLDAAIGDGDLGVTVGDGSRSIRAALAGMSDEASVADTVGLAGRTFATANPSTFGALVGMGLMRAAGTIGDDPVEADGLAAFGRAFFDAVAAKGKSAPGDKTILDALGPALDALDASLAAGKGVDGALAAMADAAERGIDAVTPLESRKGRARWLGERSRGHADPGSVALLRFLQALRAAAT